MNTNAYLVIYSDPARDIWFHWYTVYAYSLFEAKGYATAYAPATEIIHNVALKPDGWED